MLTPYPEPSHCCLFQHISAMVDHAQQRAAVMLGGFSLCLIYAWGGECVQTG